MRLKLSNLHLDAVQGALSGYVLFAGSGRRNKSEKGWESVLTEEGRGVRDRLAAEYVLRGPGPEDPGYLFPHSYQLDAPMTVDIASELHDRAEEMAGAGHLSGGTWHPYRRAHDTIHVSPQPGDVAASTGRKDATVMLQRYQKVNRGAIYEALTQRCRVAE